MRFEIVAGFYLNEIYDIYVSLKPSLLRIAKKFRVANPDSFIQEWMGSAFLVANKLDKDREQKELLHIQVEELKNFKGYLIASFKNDLIKNYSKTNRNKIISLTSDSEDGTDIDVAAAPVLDEQGFRISDFRSAVALDLNSSNLSFQDLSKKDIVVYCFKQAMYQALFYLEHKLGNPVIVDEETKTFTKTTSDNMNDLFCELEHFTNLALCKLAQEEFCPAVQEKLLELCNGEGVALRIAGYFTAKDGISARIDTDLDIVAKPIKNTKLRISKAQRSNMIKKLSHLNDGSSEEELRSALMSVVNSSMTLLKSRENELRNRIRV